MFHVFRILVYWIKKGTTNVILVVGQGPGMSTMKTRRKKSAAVGLEAAGQCP